MAFLPKPGRPNSRAIAKMKLSKLTGLSSAVRTVAASTAGQRTVLLRATTSAHGAPMPQLS